MRTPLPRPSLGRSQRGFALLIVLWSIVLLALLATQITAAGRSELQLAANLREAASAEAAADGGVFMAVFHVLDGPAARWDADGSLHETSQGRFRLQVRIEDENGKINPNTAPQDLLAGLLSAEGADPSTSQSIARAIVDWRSPGNAQIKVQQYRSAGRGLAPDGLPFRTVAELGNVLGMTPELLARVTPHLSVYADGGVEYVHADPVVQSVLRLASGGPPPASPGPPPPPTVATIISEATDARGGRFVRRAVIAFAPDQAGRLFRPLTWQTGPSLTGSSRTGPS
jgi:general secretion pathway protein K